MRDNVIRFINKYPELFEAEDFRKIYQLALTEIPFQVGNLTYNMIQAGINPFVGLEFIMPEMFSNSRVETLVIPDNIKEIKRCAFLDCFELKEITLPSNLRRIHDTSFKGCYELASIKFNGTKEQWHNVHVPPGTFFDCSTGMIDCTDGEVLISMNESLLRESTEPTMEQLITAAKQKHIYIDQLFRKVYKVTVNPIKFLDQITAGMQGNYREKLYNRIKLATAGNEFYDALYGVVYNKPHKKLRVARVVKEADGSFNADNGADVAAFCDLLGLDVPAMY